MAELKTKQNDESVQAFLRELITKSVKNIKSGAFMLG
jgi:hypothetical protein